MPNKIQLAEFAIKNLESEIKGKEALIAGAERNLEKATQEHMAVSRIIVGYQGEVKKVEAYIKTLSKDKTKLAEAKKKLDGLKKTLDDTIKKGAEVNKKRQMIEAAPEQAKLALVRLEKELVEARKNLVKVKEEVKQGIADYGKARTDYLNWFAGEENKLNGLLKEGENAAAETKKALTDTEAAVNQGKTDAAQTAAKLAEAAATKATAACNKVEQLIGTWTSKWTEQRNLHPKTFGVEEADVAVHAGVTNKAYATFKVGDAGRDTARASRDAAAQDAEEAKSLAASGKKDMTFAVSVVGRAKQGLAKLVDAYDGTCNNLWGATIMKEGGSMADILKLLQTNREKGMAPALKVIEQGGQIMPKVIERARAQVKQIGQYVATEIKKIPPEFQRALKSETDKLRMEVMKVAQLHTAYEGKYKKAMELLKKIEDATK